MSLVEKQSTDWKKQPTLAEKQPTGEETQLFYAGKQPTGEILRARDVSEKLKSKPQEIFLL
ncbi:MAG TPA: hypothetical protein VNB22_06980 [Pyrinomonadaceae bacterium]|nr:hypothetical protein [Pyrinomonadaceae bacterium]